MDRTTCNSFMLKALGDVVWTEVNLGEGGKFCTSQRGQTINVQNVGHSTTSHRAHEQYLIAHADKPLSSRSVRVKCDAIGLFLLAFDKQASPQLYDAGLTCSAVIDALIAMDPNVVKNSGPQQSATVYSLCQSKLCIERVGPFTSYEVADFLQLSEPSDSLLRRNLVKLQLQAMGKPSCEPSRNSLIITQPLGLSAMIRGARSFPNYIDTVQIIHIPVLCQSIRQCLKNQKIRENNRNCCSNLGPSPVIHRI
jgi:hypothetical protein